MEDSNLIELLRDRIMGFNAYCGVEYEAVSQGRCRVSCRLEPHHLNPAGFVHGGMICTLMDVAGGSAAIFACGEYRSMVTQSAEVHYLRPVRGARMYAEAECLKAGRRSAVVEVKVFGDDAETLCAAGTFEFCYLDL